MTSTLPKNSINPKDVSVVVQGAVDAKHTPRCLASIRKYLPGAYIILSTWEGQKVEGLDCDKVVTSGGGSVSALWRQMQADVFDMPVYTMSGASEGGAFGACMVAGVGAGIWKDLEEACRLVKVETETWPVKENQAAYKDAFEIYAKIYPALKPVYDLSASKGY